MRLIRKAFALGEMEEQAGDNPCLAETADRQEDENVFEQLWEDVKFHAQPATGAATTIIVTMASL